MKGKIVLAGAVAVVAGAALLLVLVTRPERGANNSTDETAAATNASTGGTTSSPRRPPRLLTDSTPEEKAARAQAFDEMRTQRNDLRASFAAKEYGKVLAEAEKILETEPNRSMVRTYAAMSACGLKNREKAMEHIAQIPNERFSFVQMRCNAFGVEIPDREGVAPSDITLQIRKMKEQAGKGRQEQMQKLNLRPETPR